MMLGTKEHEQSVHVLESFSTVHGPSVPGRSLPPYNPEHRARRLCVIGLGLTSLLSIVAIYFGVSLLHKTSIPLKSTATKEIVALVLNICVTGCTECLGFIHTTSLRWALYSEGRLHSNSNLRLFTSAKKCAANKWYVNGLWAILIAFSYSSASQAILPTAGFEEADIPYVLCPQALIILGVALLLQTLLATWCMIPRKQRKILSWNSSPLNTALACLHDRRFEESGLDHPNLPTHSQPSAQSLLPPLRYIAFAIWALVPLVTAWGVTIWLLTIRDVGHIDSSFNADDDTGGVYPLSALNGSGQSVLWNYQQTINILIITSMQLLYTLALHAAELAVNISRDEMQWRRAADLSKGAQVSLGSVQAAFSSWQTLTLLILKPVSHWLFGIAAVTFSFGYLVFHPLPIFCLGGMSLLLATFVTVLGWWRPRGPQPAAYGDLGKLARFIDDWGAGADAVLFWGDKGILDESGGQVVRLAGTSSREEIVAEIHMNGELYIGL